MTQIRIRVPALAATVLAGAAVTGCSNFKNPLDWEESPAADELIGTWYAVEGDDLGTEYDVSRTDDGTLRFDARFPEGTPATGDKDKTKDRAVFLAKLLGSGAVDVLQVDVSSYEEFEAAGTALRTMGSGYIFRRVEFLPNGDLSVKQLARGTLGRLAEAELADSGWQLDASTIHGCLSDDMQMFALASMWREIADDLDDELLAEVVTAAFGEDDAASLDEVERELERFEDFRLDPYKELSRLRTCIARHLPSEALGRILLSHADQVFPDEDYRYVRVQN